MKYKKVITHTKPKKLKVALILTGFMRNWDFNYPFIKKEILDTYDPDVYISSYTYSQFYTHPENKSSDVPIDIEKVVDTYKPTKYLFRDNETCPPFRFKLEGKEMLGRPYSLRQIWGWYTNYLALDLCDVDNYDYIIKLRTDIALRNFRLDKKYPFVIPAWKIHPGPCEPQDSVIDYFAYGTPKYMKKYLELYTKMQEMHQSGIADISLGETLLKDYIDHYIGGDNLYFDFVTDWNLRGEMWETDRVLEFKNNSPEDICSYQPKIHSL